MIKFLVVCSFSIKNIFRLKSTIINSEIVFDGSIKRLCFQEVYKPIIKILPNSRWTLLARSKEITCDNTNSYVLIEQKNSIFRYANIKNIKFILYVLSLRFRYGNIFPLNHYFLFIQEYLYFERLIKIIKFKLFISFRDSAFTPVMYGVLKKHGIKSIVLQHGFYPRSDPRKNMKYNYYEYLFVFSKAQEDIFYNYHESKIDHCECFGSPLLNHKISSLKHRDFYDLCIIEQIGTEEYFKIDEFLFLVKVVLDFAKFNNLSVAYCNRYMRLSRSINTKNINERLYKVDSLLDDYNFVVRKEDSYQTIFDSYLTVTKNSTMGLEAIGMNRNILICDFYRQTGLYPQQNQLFFVHDMNEIAITNGLTDIMNADKGYLNKELEKIKPLYMVNNTEGYFEKIKEIVSSNI